MRLPYSNNSQRRSLHRWFLNYPDGYFRIAPFRIIDFKIYGLSVLLRACASFLQGRIDDCQYITGNCDFVVCV